MHEGRPEALHQRLQLEPQSWHDGARCCTLEEPHSALLATQPATDQHTFPAESARRVACRLEDQVLHGDLHCLQGQSTPSVLPDNA